MMKKLKLIDVSISMLIDWVAVLSIICFMLHLTYLSIGENEPIWNMYYFLIDAIWKLGIGIYIHFHIFSKTIKHLFKPIILYFTYGLGYQIWSLFDMNLYENLLHNPEYNKIVYICVIISIFLFALLGSFFVKKRHFKKQKNIYEQ